MTKKEVMNYVVETPQNVNKNILGQKLDEFQKNVSWDDLKDKPFYREVVTKVAVERQIAEFRMDGDWGYMFPITLPNDLYDSKEVDILWNGVVYRASGFDFRNNDFATQDGRVRIVEYMNQVYFITWEGQNNEIGITYTGEIIHQVPPPCLSPTLCGLRRKHMSLPIRWQLLCHHGIPTLLTAWFICPVSSL